MISTKKYPSTFPIVEAFHTFPCLEELDLSLNGIVDIAIEPGHLSRLHALNLSYNSLSEWALLVLGTLPQLKVLHLTGRYYRYIRIVKIRNKELSFD